jgi:uncharacterized membrane protein YjdF
MTRPIPRGLGPAFAFTGAYIAIFAVWSFAAGTPGLAIYLALMAVLVPLFYFLHRRYPLGAALIWSLSVWGLLHMAGGLVQVPLEWPHEGTKPMLYNWWLAPRYLKYDHVVHAYGFGITTWLCWHILKTALRSPDGSPVAPTPGILIVCMAGGMGFGAFNEVVEFVFTRVQRDTNVGDYANTGWDLLANLVGSLVAVILIRGSQGHRP